MGAYAGAMGRLKRWFGLNLLRVLVRPLGEAARRGFVRPELQVRELDRDEVIAFAADPALEVRPAQVRVAYEDGGVCIGAFDGGRLVAYTWLAYRPTPWDRATAVHFEAHARYSYKSFVLPRYRGRRLVQALHAFADDPELSRGRSHAFDLVDSHNAASLCALRRTGSRPAGFVGSISLGRTTRTFRSPGARRFGVRLVPSETRPS